MSCRSSWRMPDTVAHPAQGLPVQALPAQGLPWPLMLFAGFLAAAGLPLYVHLPDFAAGLGISLTSIGLMLIGLRVLDLVQDPILGLLVDRFRDHRSTLAALAVLGMSAGFAAVFFLQPGLPGMIAALVLLFVSYSLASILFYAQGVAIAQTGVATDHYRLAGYRETGGLAGILIASAAPSLLIAAFDERLGYAVFGAALAAAGLAVWWSSASLWTARWTAPVRFSPSDFLAAGGGRLLVLGLVNTLPVAITSSLFLFFVEDRLQLGAWSGAFLVLFFLTAGISAPFWSGLVKRVGPVRVLVPAMVLSVLVFIGAAALPAGNALGFAAISALSGLTLGADMVILPALFSVMLARANLPAGAGFGLWGFTSKLALALAAAVVLPWLDWVGYVPGAANSPDALWALNVSYAIVPCFLKLLAIVLVTTLPSPREVQ
jgi:GPH family glycoside/pentoside/hexuronide:cation symporter